MEKIIILLILGRKITNKAIINSIVWILNNLTIQIKQITNNHFFKIITITTPILSILWVQVKIIIKIHNLLQKIKIE